MFNTIGLDLADEHCQTEAMSRSVGQHHGNLRPVLLRAAVEAVAAGPIAAVSLRAVARRVGVSPAAVYHHFADKRALLGAVAEEGFRHLYANLAAAGSTDAPTARLGELVASYVRFGLAHLAHYRVMWDPALGADPTSPPPNPPSPLERAARAAFGLLVDAVGGVTDASFDEVRRRAVLAWALAHGAVELAGSGLPEKLDPDLDPDRLGRAVADAVVQLATRT